MDMFSRINSCSSSVAAGGFHCSGSGEKAQRRQMCWASCAKAQAEGTAPSASEGLVVCAYTEPVLGF